MDLYVIGVNYKMTPVQIREKFSICEEKYQQALAKLRLLRGVSECALLSTCNRTEIHIFSDSDNFDTGAVETCLCAFNGIDIFEAKKFFYVYKGIKG